MNKVYENLLRSILGFPQETEQTQGMDLYSLLKLISTQNMSHFDSKAAAMYKRRAENRYARALQGGGSFWDNVGDGFAEGMEDAMFQAQRNQAAIDALLEAKRAIERNAEQSRLNRIWQRRHDQWAAMASPYARKILENMRGKNTKQAMEAAEPFINSYNRAMGTNFRLKDINVETGNIFITDPDHNNRLISRNFYNWYPDLEIRGAAYINEQNMAQARQQALAHMQEESRNSGRADRMAKELIESRKERDRQWRRDWSRAQGLWKMENDMDSKIEELNNTAHEAEKTVGQLNIQDKYLDDLSVLVDKINSIIPSAVGNSELAKGWRNFIMNGEVFRNAGQNSILNKLRSLGVTVSAAESINNAIQKHFAQHNLRKVFGAGHVTNQQTNFYLGALADVWNDPEAARKKIDYQREEIAERRKEVERTQTALAHRKKRYNYLISKYGLYNADGGTNTYGPVGSDPEGAGTSGSDDAVRYPKDPVRKTLRNRDRSIYSFYGLTDELDDD